MSSIMKNPANPINKSLIHSIRHKTNEKNEFKKNNIARDKKPNSYGISVITCTNRPSYMHNVFDNFINQSFDNKELIVILNDNKMNLKKWIDKAKKYENPIKIFQIDQNKSLGYCLNFGISEASHEIIAKFDDDDYYSPRYLSESINAFKYADVIGKATTYVYFEASNTLAIRSPKRDNRYVFRLEGPTLLFKKEVFNVIKFPDKSLGEDIQFCKDCTKNGIKMYSTDKYNYVYIRHGLVDKHAWNISDALYIKLCKVIKVTDNYKIYVDSINKCVTNNNS